MAHFLSIFTSWGQAGSVVLIIQPQRDGQPVLILGLDQPGLLQLATLSLRLCLKLIGILC